MATAISGIAGLASSVIGGLIGSKATGNATNQILGGLNNAQNAVTTGINQANQQIDQNFGTAQTTLNPYTTAGTQAINSLATGLAPGGQFTQTMDPSQILQQNPGYQFDLAQGEQAIQRGASAQGTGISGGELKDLTTYAQGNALNAYQQAFQNYNTTQSLNFSRLQDLAGMGESAASQSANLSAQQGTTLAGVDVAGQDNLANIYEQEGNTRAAGTLGQTSSILSALSGGISGAATALSSIPAVTSALGGLFGSSSLSTPTTSGVYAGGVAPNGLPVGPTGIYG